MPRFGFYDQCKILSFSIVCLKNSGKASDRFTISEHVMNESAASKPSKLTGFSRFALYVRKVFASLGAVIEGFYLVYRHQLYKDPNNPVNTRYVQYFCRKLCKVFNIDVKVHGEIPRKPALWVSNHISWLDVAVLGSGARVFFLAKAEIEKWPLLGKLAKGGGTLFIKRGSGDSIKIREQIAAFLKQDTPVLFFPEATTSDGSCIKKVHGRLLGAAIEAEHPVQICLICYVNKNGELDMVAPFIGEMTFAEHVQNVLEMPKVTAHLTALPAIESAGHTVDSLTREVQHKMTEGLAALQAQVLGHSIQKPAQD